MSEIVKRFSSLLADTYALYLKTQNYHWHVKGPNFKTLHELFEEQYTELAVAVDELAERIRILGSLAPASFKEFETLKTLQDGDPNAPSETMLNDIHGDHLALVKMLNEALAIAADAHDEGSVALLSERIAAHEKMAWMLVSSI